MINYAHVNIRYNNVRLEINYDGGYQSRNISMVRLIRDAWESMLKNDLQPYPMKFFTLYTDDNFNPWTHFSFAAKDESSSFRSMPNFIFDGWPEVGMPDYMEVFGRMLESGECPPRSDRAFWVGVVHTKEGWPGVRHKGQNVAERRPDIFEFRSICWNPADPSCTPGYIPMWEHGSSRVLVDFGGFGFSARLPLLLASGRPVVIVSRPDEAWFYWDGSLRPWEHYVPCGGPDSVNERDIEEAIEWTFQNRSEAADIGRRGREYAETRSAAVRRIGLMMDGFCGDMFSSVKTRLIGEG